MPSPQENTAPSCRPTAPVPPAKFELDSFITKHLNWEQQKKYVLYSIEELRELTDKAIEMLKKEESLVTTNPPLTIVGDIHGQLRDLMRMFSFFTKKGVHGCLRQRFLFLGDYVDRGPRSMECINLLLALKMKYPKQYLLLRGNHEVQTINFGYGFRDEVVDRFYSSEEGEEMWGRYNKVFSYLPLAAVVGGKILCMHGGISPELKSLDDIKKIPRPLVDPHDSPLALDLLWSDPMQGFTGWTKNELRGVSISFGEDRVYALLKSLKLQMIVRGHQMMMPGYGFFANRKLVTIFTAPRYQQAQNNMGAVMTISAQGRVGFKLLHWSDEVSEHGEKKFAKDFNELGKNPGFTMNTTLSASTTSTSIKK